MARPSIKQVLAAGRREEAALRFEAIAESIEDGSLTIKGTGAGPVRDRMRQKAAAVRRGELRVRTSQLRDVDFEL